MNTTRTLILVMGILIAMVAVNTGFGQVSKSGASDEQILVKANKHGQKAMKHEQKARKHEYKLQKVEMKSASKWKVKAHHPKQKMKIKPVKQKDKSEKIGKKAWKTSEGD